MIPFDMHLEAIGQQITVQHRESYTKDFDRIRDFLLNNMCNLNSTFKKIYRGPSLFGSYSNNVRINQANEFDVHVTLEFPFTDSIRVRLDKKRPGYIYLDMKKMFKKLEAMESDIGLIETFEDFIENKNPVRFNCLRRSSLQLWIEGIIDDVLDKYGDTVVGWSGITYKLEYSKRGTAHTIYASHKDRSISIDFVPAIVFGPTQWMDIRTDYPFTNKCDEWLAIPKPTCGPKATRKHTFMICNAKVEHDLLLNKQNLKVVFRLLKAFKKKYRMQRLKSYFIITAFLWEIENQNDRFWNNSLSFLFLHMLYKLFKYFDNGDLPFFWDDENNLLDILLKSEILDYRDILCKAFNTFSSYKHQPQLSLQRCEEHFYFFNYR